jgi:hypothetical protein
LLLEPAQALLAIFRIADFDGVADELDHGRRGAIHSGQPARRRSRRVGSCGFALRGSTSGSTS